MDSSFRKIIGQEKAADILESALQKERVPHAYLFVGPPGVGRFQGALQLAKMLNCLKPLSAVEACEDCSACRRIEAGSHPDVMRVNFDFQARLNREPVEKQKVLKINTIREMERTLHMRSAEGKVKVAIIHPAEKLMDPAAHALLKILEEPPSNTHLILIAEDARQLLVTIRSRCQWVQFRPLPLHILTETLLENNPGLTAEDARAAALRAEGSLVRAESIVEEGTDIDLDWACVPVSELLAWCEQFRGVRQGRDGAEKFLRTLLGQVQSDLHQDPTQIQPVYWVLKAMGALRNNVSPQLVLEVLLLKLRRERKQRQEEKGKWQKVKTP